MMAAIIVIAVIVIIVAAILSISATFTITYTDKWKTTISILWIEKDIELTKILNFILFPQNAANRVKSDKEKKNKKVNAVKAENNVQPAENKNSSAEDVPSKAVNDVPKPEKNEAPAAQKEKKPNFLKNIWDKDGVVGILEFVSNMAETASSAISVLIKGFHIYSLYVKIIVGGGDADEIARAYGRICRFYYPFKGAVLAGMKVDNYDDLIVPDFIAPKNEYGLQFIGSISVGLLLKVGLAAVKTFLVNIIKNK